MPDPIHCREALYRKVVCASFEETLGVHDMELINYVVRMLCGFTRAEELYKLRDSHGRSIEELEEMLRASDPVFGTASSFQAERAARKLIGDYALYVAGMFPETTLRGPYSQPSLGELIRVGKESYFIVSLFRQGEDAAEAKLYARLSEAFDRCVLGLALVRDKLTPELMLPRPVCVR